MGFVEGEGNEKKIDPRRVLKVVAKTAAVRVGNPSPDTSVYDNLSDEQAEKMLEAVKKIEKALTLPLRAY